MSTPNTGEDEPYYYTYPFIKGRRKTPLRAPGHRNWAFPRSPPSATTIARFTPMDDEYDITSGLTACHVSSNEFRDLVAQHDGQLYGAHLNPLRHSPEDRRRRRDNRFWETEQMLLAQTTNAQVHGPTIEEEWVWSKLDVKNDWAPRGRHMKYRIGVANVVEAELNASMQDDEEFREAGEVAKAGTRAWRAKDENLPAQRREEVLLIALTAPARFRHVIPGRARPQPAPQDVPSLQDEPPSPIPVPSEKQGVTPEDFWRYMFATEQKAQMREITGKTSASKQSVQRALPAMSLKLQVMEQQFQCVANRKDLKKQYTTKDPPPLCRCHTCAQLMIEFMDVTKKAFERGDLVV